MKIAINIIALFLYLGAFAQPQSYTWSETQAEFPGGVGAMYHFINNNINFPAKVYDAKVGGKALVKFDIDENGGITNTTIIKSTCVPELDAEALRVVSSMPKWKPAMQNGKNIKSDFIGAPVTFSFSTPYFIFYPDNKNSDYIRARKEILSKNYVTALSIYSGELIDLEAMFNSAVIYFLINDKVKARQYFEGVVLYNTNYFSKASQIFLNNSF